MLRRNTSIILILLVFFNLPLRGQQLVPKGSFLEDSIRIGQPVPFALSFQYPKDMQVIFPDSNFNFSPFELYSREYFSTISDTASSKDSAVYYLMSFEIDPIQTLSLPVYLLAGEDSTSIHTDVDSIYFSEVIQSMPDSVVLKENLDHNYIKSNFNIYSFTLIAVWALFIVLLGLIMFSKPLRRKLRIYFTKRDFDRFIKIFDASISEFEKNTTSDQLNESVFIWKKYMEKVMDLPYTKMTTKEIEEIDPRKSRARLLRRLDRSIYGGTTDIVEKEGLERLKKQAELSYREKIVKLENG